MAQAWLFLLIFAGGIEDADAQYQPEPLENALWRGELRVHVTGPMFTQYLANHIDDQGKVNGFIKEKGEFTVDYTLVVRFLLNAVGESSMAADEIFVGDYNVNRESRIHFREEIILKKQRTSYMQDVHISETTITKIPFTREQGYDQENFRFGNLRFLPTGRMDSKGQVQVLADLKIPFSGEGKRTITRERQPPKKTEPNERKSASLQKTVLLPISFAVTIAHRKDAVQGVFPVTVDVSSPFPSEDDENTNKRTFSPKLKAEGSFSMTPLFDKKKKKRKKNN